MNNFHFKYIYVIKKSSIVELRSSSSVSLLHSVPSFIGITVLGAFTAFLQINSWSSGNLCFFAYKFMYPPYQKHDSSRLLLQSYFVLFLLLVFANNLLILFWFFVFVAVMRSVGEFSVSESSIEGLCSLGCFIFLFFGKDLVCFKVCRAFWCHGIPNCALSNCSCFVEHDVWMNFISSAMFVCNEQLASWLSLIIRS